MLILSKTVSIVNMQEELLIAMFTGLGGMFGWGLADFFAKKTIDKVGPIVSLVWAHVFGTLVFAAIALYTVLILKTQMVFPVDLGVWGGLLFFGALQAAVYLLAYVGFGKGQLAVLNPVFASYSGATAFISIVVFGEAASLNRVLALAVIFVGVLSLSIDVKGLRSKRINFVQTPGLKEVGLAAILAAIWTLSWDRFVGGKDFLMYALFMYAFMTLAAFGMSRIMKTKLSIRRQSGAWIFMVFIGICEVVAYLSISLGFSVTSFTSIVALISGAFSLPTIILAHIFLKERVNVIQRAGTFIIIAGVIILAIMQ